jgi:hypothetical protein
MRIEVKKCDLRCKKWELFGRNENFLEEMRTFGKK